MNFSKKQDFSFSFIWSVIIFISAVLVRLFYVYLSYYPGFYETLSDDIAYMNLAQNILEQGFWLKDLEILGSYSSVVGPGIGWIILPVVAILGNNWLAIFIYVSFGSALIPVFIYKIAQELYANGIALFASLIAIFYVSFIKYTLSTGKDLWMTLLLIVVIYLFVRQRKDKAIHLMSFLGMAYVVLVHIDERMLIFAPVFVFFILLDKKFVFSIRWKKSLLFTGLVILFMIPWLVRNYQVYNRIILVSVRTNPYTEKIFGYTEKQYFPSHEGRWFIREGKIDSIRQGIIDNPIEQVKKIKSQQHVDAIKSGILPTKFNYWQTCWSSFLNFWEPIDVVYGYYQTGYRFDGKWSLKHNLSVGLTYGVMLIFSLFGFYYLFRRERYFTIFFLSLILLYMLVHVFAIPFTNSRYRLPIEPIIIIYGSYGLYIVFWKKSLRERFSQIFKNIKYRFQ